MTADDRYDVSGLPEAQFEPGSNGQVLKNRLGITSQQDMDDTEARALAKTMDALVRTYSQAHRVTAADLCEWHRTWLGDIYEWAGRYRQVNLGKDDFPFAAAARISSLMEQLEHEVLRRCTPCNFADRTAVTRALAEPHVELVLIHPFREGNGRLARVLSTLMALQAGLPLLDYSVLAGAKKQEYFAAVRVGLDKNYAPMERLFSEIIERSLSAS